MVPLTPDILTVLETLLQFKKGNFIFSTMFGAQGGLHWRLHQEQVDARMLRMLKAPARQRGDDPFSLSIGRTTTSAATFAATCHGLGQLRKRVKR